MIDSKLLDALEECIIRHNVTDPELDRTRAEAILRVVELERTVELLGILSQRIMGIFVDAESEAGSRLVSAREKAEL